MPIFQFFIEQKQYYPNKFSLTMNRTWQWLLVLLLILSLQLLPCFSWRRRRTKPPPPVSHENKLWYISQLRLSQSLKWFSSYTHWRHLIKTFINSNHHSLKHLSLLMINYNLNRHFFGKYPQLSHIRACDQCQGSTSEWCLIRTVYILVYLFVLKVSLAIFHSESSLLGFLVGPYKWRAIDFCSYQWRCDRLSSRKVPLVNYLTLYDERRELKSEIMQFPCKETTQIFSYF